MSDDLQNLVKAVANCRLCSEKFEQTATRHRPRPVLWLAPDTPAPRILIAGQAPGARVHESGRPFSDASGDRLRDWLGLDEASFYARNKIAIVPMAFCFPGYNSKGSDLPPPPICAKTWREPLMQSIGTPPLTLLVGGHAMTWHLGEKRSVNDTVAAWRDHAPQVFPLPHPSWRNTGWLKKNPWFEAELLPVLRKRVQEVLR